jgi:hypothetical protein
VIDLSFDIFHFASSFVSLAFNCPKVPSITYKPSIASNCLVVLYHRNLSVITVIIVALELEGVPQYKRKYLIPHILTVFINA